MSALIAMSRGGGGKAGGGQARECSEHDRHSVRRREGQQSPGPQEVADFIRTPAGAMVGWPGGECAGLEKIIRPPGSRRIRPTPYSDRRPHGQHLFMNSIAILNSPARKSAPKSNFRAKHRQSSICPALTLPRKTSVRMPVSRTDSGVPSWTTRPLSNT